MANELEELDPDLMFDMPEQQANGLYHQGLDDSLDFQQNGLSLSLSDLGAGFGNALADVSDSYDILSPIQNAPFSLADELADAFHPKDNASSGLLAELELETALDDREQDLLSSVQSSPLRNAKSSRATVSSQTRTDDDNYATNAVFEEETRELQESTRSIQGFCSVLQDYNHASARAVGESEGRIEILASNLIRKTYEHVKQCEEGVRELQAIEADLKLEAIWLVQQQPLVANSNGDIDPQHNAGTSSTLQEAATAPSGGTAQMIDASDEGRQGALQLTAEFRILTDELSGSLATLSELLQVNRATASDSWRKIRGMEAGLSRLRSELESLHLSQERITRWEDSQIPRESAIPGLAAQMSKRLSPNSTAPLSDSTGSLGSQAHKQLLAAQHLLDAATVRAQALLTFQP